MLPSQFQCKHTKVVPTTIDHISSNTTHSGAGAMLYVFEDNEAVIKMIIEGRSPTMRHVSRTHRVALDWLFDRINLDPKIQTKYVDTKNQLADMFTEGNSRTHLFRLSVQHHEFLDVFLLPFSFNKKPNTMSKRAQEGRTEEEHVVAKSRPVSLISVRLSANQSPMLASGISYRVQGVADRVGILISQAVRDQGETESKTQRRVLKCGTEMTILFPSTERSWREMNERSSTGAKSTESTYQSQVEPPQSRDLP